MTRKQLERLSDQLCRASGRLYKSHRALYKSSSDDDHMMAECMENADGSIDRAITEIARCLEIIEEREAGEAGEAGESNQTGAHDTPTKKLYAWGWIGGGFNQCWANHASEAYEIGDAMSVALCIDDATFRLVGDPRHYFANLPMFD